MPTTQTDAPTQRILTVAEAIAKHGPITLDDLTRVLTISRAAIWRALNTLRGQGWVRMRAGDNAFEMRSDIVDRFKNGHRSSPDIEAISPIRDQIAGFGPVHVELGGFTRTGIFQILESTRKSFYAQPSDKLSLVDDDLAIAAQLTIPPPALVVHLRAYMVTSRDEERRIITSGKHGRTIASLREFGHIWLPDRTGISISLPQNPGYALRAELWRLGKSDIAKFSRQIEELLQKMHLRAAPPLTQNPIYSVKSNDPSSDKNTNP